MAKPSVYIGHKSGRKGLHVRVQHPDGRRTWHPLHTEDKALARKLAQPYASALRTEITEENGGGRRPPPTFTVKNLLQYARDGVKVRSKDHKDRTEWSCANLEAYFGADAPADGIDHAALLAYANFRRENGYADASIKADLAALRYCQIRAVEDDKVRKVTRHPELVLRARNVEVPDEHRKAILRYLKPDKYQAHLFTAIALFTGMRHKDVVSLEWSNFDWKSKPPRVTFWMHKRRRDKPKLVTLPLVPPLPKLLKKAKKAEGRLFVGNDFRTACRRTTKAACGVQYGPHAFRHWLGTHLARIGMAPQQAALLLGHDDPKTILKFYTHLKHTEAVDASAGLNFTP